MAKKLTQRVKEGVLVLTAALSLGFASCSPITSNYTPTALLSALQQDTNPRIIMQLDGSDLDGKQDIIKYKAGIDLNNDNLLGDNEVKIESNSPITDGIISTGYGAFNVLGECIDSQGAVGRSSVDFENAISENINYNVNVDLINVAFQDGTYQIPVTIIPSSGDQTPITKTVTLVLSGVVNYANGNSDDTGVYTPTDFWVQETINSIEGLPPNSNVNIQIFSSDDAPTGVPSLSNANVLNYLIVDVTTQDDSANINFIIKQSLITDTNKVSLYVLENGAWTKLSTSFAGTTTLGAIVYDKFTATTPHFSTFMIAEDTTPSTNQGGNDIGSGADTGGSRIIPNDYTPANQATNLANTENNAPITANNPSPVTGSVIGNFIKSGAGIVTLILFVALVASGIGLALRKKK